jgi:hypothetical protein
MSYIYTYKHCTWRSATAVKTLVQETIIMIKSTDISLDRQTSSASVIWFEKLSRDHQLSWHKLLKIIILNFILFKYKWPYEKDALARESRLCVAGALIGRLWQIQNLYHWSQSKLERTSKTEKKEFLDPRVCNLIWKIVTWPSVIVT